MPIDMCLVMRVSSANKCVRAIAAVDRELITLDRLATVFPVHRSDVEVGIH